MTNAIDDAIVRLQELATACTGVTFKSAPDYPVDNVEPFPCSIAYISGGQFWFTNASMQHNFPVIAVEFHFSRVNLKQAYQQINLLALEYPKRLAGDPTLDASIDTILATRDTPIAYTARPFQWTAPGVTPIITSQVLIFNIPIKSLQAPTT